MPDKKSKPIYAPGMDDTDIIPRATKEDKRKGNVTVETRVVLDENDPSGKDLRNPD
jgi:hypothetical protein